MFCKWCGNTLFPTETKCKRCGKEIPALSDCGGFYDLVPTAKPPVERGKCESKPEQDRSAGSVCEDAAPVRDREKAESKADRRVPVKKKGKVRPLSVPFAVALICILVLLLQLLLLNGKISQQAEAMEGLKNDLNTLIAQIQEFHRPESKPSATVPEHNVGNSTGPLPTAESTGELTEPAQTESVPTAVPTEPVQTKPESTAASTAAPTEPLRTEPEATAATTEPPQTTPPSTTVTTAATVPPAAEPEPSDEPGSEN